jgi:protein MpaA
VRALAAAAAALALGAPAPVPAERIGRSVEGRPIGVTRVGDPAAPRRVLVVGCIHGDECAGRAIVDALRRVAPPPGIELLLVRDANPDGFARRTRGNAHGVDLNRNAAQGWRRGDGHGHRAFSEPESRALRALVLSERPAVTVWYHQPLWLVDHPESGGAALARRYAHVAGLPFGRLPAYPGSLSRWINARVRPGSSFVVELPRGRLRPPATLRHVAALLEVSRPPARRAAPAAPRAPASRARATRRGARTPA